jgi:hypothetical protein
VSEKRRREEERGRGVYGRREGEKVESVKGR